MKDRLPRILIVFLLVSATVSAQEGLEYHRFSPGRTGTPVPGGEPLSTGHSGTGVNIDVVYHRIDWSINPAIATKTVTGTVVTYFKTLVANVSAINFDFNKASFNNGSLKVFYHGITCGFSFPASGATDTLNITLPAPIVAANTLDSVTIVYSGVPPGVVGAAQGYQAPTFTDQENGSGTIRYHTSLSESYEDRDFWPCKADMQDKIDSMDINVTVPWSGNDTFWVQTNGKLIDSQIVGGNRTFKFKTRYPIASYLVCLASSKSKRYYRSVNIGSTNVPVTYNLLAGRSAAYYSNAITALDKINNVLIAFSQKFGDYPFKLEKHGFYDGLVGAGGMEHQTFSGISTGSITSLSTLSHELMHQWFGDNVTFGTWNDLWLAEGFARYSESLAGELVPSLGLNVPNIRNNCKTAALGYLNTSAYIPNSNTGNSDLIWNSNYGGTVYDRGGMVVSMLRAMCGDTKFFQALTNYQTNLAGKSATTDSLRNYFNAVLGVDISEFFRDYVGGSGASSTLTGGVGNPVYNIKWNSPAANRLNVRVNTQTQTGGSNVTYFNGPVVLHVKGAGAGQDTTICFFDWGSGSLSYAGNGIGAPIPGNLLSYELSFTPTTVAYDDSARTMSTGTTTPDATLEGYVWYGGSSTAWNTSGNWATCCGVPPTNADVTIATTTNAPTLPGAVTIRHLTLNAAKVLNIGSNTLTVTGAIRGTGTLTGSAGSNLILNAANTGLLNFTQTSTATRTLNSLTLNPSAQAILNNALETTSLLLNAGASFTVNAGVTLLTK